LTVLDVVAFLSSLTLFQLQAMLVLFSNGDPARVWGRRAPAERRAAALNQLTKWFGPEAAQPKLFV